MLQIQMPDETHWIRASCPLCQQPMEGVRVRPFSRQDTGAPAVFSQYCCPGCQFWLHLTLPREVAARYTTHPYILDGAMRPDQQTNLNESERNDE